MDTLYSKQMSITFQKNLLLFFYLLLFPFSFNILCYLGVLTINLTSTKVAFITHYPVHVFILFKVQQGRQYLETEPLLGVFFHGNYVLTYIIDEI